VYLELLKVKLLEKGVGSNLIYSDVSTSKPLANINLKHFVYEVFGIRIYMRRELKLPLYYQLEGLVVMLSLEWHFSNDHLIEYAS
jgi:hypothetical protein